MIKTKQVYLWDISQVKDLDQARIIAQDFVNSAYKREPDTIHQVRFVTQYEIDEAHEKMLNQEIK